MTNWLKLNWRITLQWLSIQFIQRSIRDQEHDVVMCRRQLEQSLANVRFFQAAERNAQRQLRRSLYEREHGQFPTLHSDVK